MNEINQYSVKEHVGEYQVILKGELIVFDDNEVLLDLPGDASLKLKIVFQKGDDNQEPKAERKVEDRLLTFTFKGFNVNNTVSGFFKPIEVGTTKSDDKSQPSYFSCVVNTVDVESGSRIIRYAFWVKN